MPPKSPPREWLLIGLACGLVAALAVKSALFVLLGSVKVLVVVGAVAVAWLVLRGPRDGTR